MAKVGEVLRVLAKWMAKAGEVLRGTGKQDSQSWGAAKDTSGGKVGGKHARAQSDASAGKGAGGKNEFGGGRN